MHIIKPEWKEKERNIEILIKYLSGHDILFLKREYNLSKSHVIKICKIQLKELLKIPSNSFNCAEYKLDKKVIDLAIKYREFLCISLGG